MSAIDGGVKARVRDLDFHYGGFQALRGIDLDLAEHQVTALIGPSGSGKSTLLRCFNRMHDLYPGNRYAGSIRLYPDAIDLLDPGIDPIEIRLRIGMVFQKPNPFPKSIFENVAYGLRVAGVRRRALLAERVEQVLREAALWEEVKDRLDRPATQLSGGQQQRLCIARALATEPELLLFDEPTAALDPIATANIESLILKLTSRLTILMVTHSMHQAGRVSTYTAFMAQGELVEFGETGQIFTNPVERRTESYITGRVG